MILPTVVSQENEEIYYKFEGDSITKKEFELSEVTVYNEINFKDTDERIKYLILRRKTLKVYPYAKLAAERLIKLNERLDMSGKVKKYGWTISNHTLMSLSLTLTEQPSVLLIQNQILRL